MKLPTELQSLACDWTRLGAMYNVAPARHTPDLEELLLRTARLAAVAPQFYMAITWLEAYGELVARQRLARLVREQLAVDVQPAMGLLLETVIEKAPRHESRFRSVIESCRRAAEPGPLLDIDRRNAGLFRLAELEATPLSRRWGRWYGIVEIKADALRPAEWVAAHNPSLALRALTGGDLVASVLAEAEAGGGVFRSEVELARRCGASRPAVREALQKLRLGGLARQERRGRANQIRIGKVT